MVSSTISDIESNQVYIYPPYIYNREYKNRLRHSYINWVTLRSENDSKFVKNKFTASWHEVSRSVNYEIEIRIIKNGYIIPLWVITLCSLEINSRFDIWTIIYESEVAFQSDNRYLVLINLLQGNKYLTHAMLVSISV